MPYAVLGPALWGGEASAPGRSKPLALSIQRLWPTRGGVGPVPKSDRSSHALGFGEAWSLAAPRLTAAPLKSGGLSHTCSMCVEKLVYQDQHPPVG